MVNKQSSQTPNTDSAPEFHSESAIEVFDFEKQWHIVQPCLHYAHVEAALTVAGFDLKKGPWVLSRTDYWAHLISERASEALRRGEIQFEPQGQDDWTEEDWDKWQKIESQFWPKPDTLEWYQCIGGCHRLAPFLRELGKLVFPDLTWKMMKGVCHSCAFGMEATGNIKVIFDILRFREHSAIQIIEAATRKYPSRYMTEVEAAEQKMIQEAPILRARAALCREVASA
jgi:hypothetical protein